MRKFQKILCLLLVAVMAISLVACGSGSGNTEATKDNTAQEKTADNTSYPVIRMAYTRMFGTPDESLVEEEMNKILREKYGCEIDLVPVDFASMQTQFNLMLTGGSDSIDIFSSFWYMPLATLVSNGQLAALDEFLDSDGEEILALFEDYPEVLECCRVSGHTYALPTVGPYSSPMGFMVMKEDADNAGIDVDNVTNLAEYTEAMLKMKEANPTHYYIPAATETYWIPKDIDYLGDTMFLGVLTDPLNSTTVENYYESDYFMDFLDNVKVWQENDLILPDGMSNTNPTLMSLQSHLVSGTPGYGYDFKESCYEANISMQYGGEVVGNNFGERLITTGNVTTYLYHITSFSTQKELAWKVLKEFYTNTELCSLLCNGIEGLHYVKNDDGTISFPEGKDMTNCGWIGLGTTYSYPNVIGCPVWDYQPADIFEIWEQSNRESKCSLALGFTFDSSAVADQVTACSNVYAQYYLPIINAEVDIDEVLPVFQKALHDAGIDAIIAEKQAQLDAWLASK